MGTTKRRKATDLSDDLRPTFYPGHVIAKELFEPLGMTQKAFCAKHGIETTQFNRILNGEIQIEASAAIQLSKAFGLSEFFFMQLQARHNLEMAKRKLSQQVRNDKDQDDGPADIVASA